MQNFKYINGHGKAGNVCKRGVGWLDMPNLPKRRLRNNTVAVYKYLKGCHKEQGEESAVC